MPGTRSVPGTTFSDLAHGLLNDAEFQESRHRRLNSRYVAAIVGATDALQCLYTEKLWRCLRAYRNGLTGTSTPAAARHLYNSG